MKAEGSSFDPDQLVGKAKTISCLAFCRKHLLTLLHNIPWVWDAPRDSIFFPLEAPWSTPGWLTLSAICPCAALWGPPSPCLLPPPQLRVSGPIPSTPSHETSLPVLSPGESLISNLPESSQPLKNQGQQLYALCQEVEWAPCAPWLGLPAPHNAA